MIKFPQKLKLGVQMLSGVAACLMLLAFNAQAGIAERAMRSKVAGVDVIVYPMDVPDVVTVLGTMPLGDAQQATLFDGNYLFQRSRGRKAPVKTFLMDQRTVVGVGNIYAAESLFRAGISPLREAGKVSRERYVALVEAVQDILTYAITRGGTTLRDFISPDGMPGYFEQELQAYGRGGEPCPRCGRPLKSANIGQRASVWCGHCQR